jgi:Asp/Glu/hydantoin racemase
MAKKRVGLIRVLTTTDKKLLNLHGEMIMGWFPELQVFSDCIPDQPEGIHDDETEAVAVPKVLKLAQEMEKNGMEAIIVSCAGDPAVDLAVGKLAVPVIGAGRSAALIARALERPVGVLGITEEVPKAILDALGSSFRADAAPRGVVSTLDLMKPEGMSATIEAGEELMKRGAEALLLACTGMSTIGAAKKLRESLGVPVIDPVRAEAAVTWLVTS